MDMAFFDIALIGIFVVAAMTVVALVFVVAPYGRFERSGWGPTLPSTMGWVVMETVAVATIAAFFFMSDRKTEVVPIVFLAMWQLHYLNRTFVFPFRRKGGKRPMPVVIMLMAMLFNVWNGYLNGYWLFELGPDRTIAWFWDPRFIIGAGLFLAGMVINHQSDSILLNLRKPGDTGYKIPKGGMFKYVSMPNYFGEIIEWTGWAIATWSISGLSFAVFTAANLVPRAVSVHKWYKNEFKNYPADRKAVIPFLI